MSKSPVTGPDRRARLAAVAPVSRTWGPGFFVKLVLMMLIDAFGLFGLVMAWRVESWVIVTVMVIALVIVNLVYFSRRMLPGKYLVPGMVFLLIFQVFVMGYTAYISLTNYGFNHMVTKDQAIAQNQIQAQAQVPDSPSYPLTMLQDGDGVLCLGVVMDGAAKIGCGQDYLESAPSATLNGDGTKIEAAEGYTVLAGLAALIKVQDQFEALSVGLEEGSTQTLHTADGSTGLLYDATLHYDPASGSMIDSASGVEYRDNGKGNFVADDGKALAVGWHTEVGFANFAKLFTDATMARPFLQVLVWTFVFSFLSVATTFLLGLLLALVFNNPRLKGQKFYRVLLILPYAFPGFMSALLWRAMLNTDYGVINQGLLGGAGIAWLQDPWLARFAVIFVNLWLGYPYMFLVCTGALQSIPSEMMESARVDGANPARAFRSITLPLLFIAVAPLLISSFAFNFNNFNLIYMLTGGGPNHSSDMTVPGSTDILISMVYRVAGVKAGQPDYGLASALSIIIFLIVGAISVYSFRKTRNLEEVG